MYPEISSFAPLPGGTLCVEFTTGETGIFDMNPYMKSKFFSALCNEEYFKSAHLQFGVITWPQGQDISPATVRLEMVAASCPAGITLRTSSMPTMA